MDNVLKRADIQFKNGRNDGIYFIPRLLLKFLKVLVKNRLASFRNSTLLFRDYKRSWSLVEREKKLSFNGF